MTTLRTQLQVARLMQMKTRVRQAWAQRQREAEEAELPVCAGCGKRHAASPGLVKLIHLIGGGGGGDDEQQAPASQLN